MNENMKFSKIIIDSNNFYYRAYYGYKIEDNELDISGIYGFLKMLNSLEKKYCIDKTEIYFLWDNSNSKIDLRSQISDEYKKNRKKQSESFLRGMDYIRLILKNHSNNYYELQLDNMESDDLCLPLIKSFDKYEKVLICSCDLDWTRCMINQDVYWLNKNEIFNREQFKNKFNFYPDSNKICLYKSIKGDKSDNIQIGLKSIKEDIVLKILNDFYDIYDFLNLYHTKNYIDDKLKEQIKQNKNKLILNWQLVSFINVDENIIKENLTKCEFNDTILRKLYHSLNLKISDIDLRLQNYFPKRNKLENNNDDFFNWENLKRR